MPVSLKVVLAVAAALAGAVVASLVAVGVIAGLTSRASVSGAGTALLATGALEVALFVAAGVLLFRHGPRTGRAAALVAYCALGIPAALLLLFSNFIIFNR